MGFSVIVVLTVQSWSPWLFPKWKHEYLSKSCKHEKLAELREVCSIDFTARHIVAVQIR